MSGSVKIDRVLLIVLAITNLVVLVIISILIYWTLKLNQLRFAQTAEQIKVTRDNLEAITKLKSKPLISNNGDMKVSGNLNMKP